MKDYLKLSDVQFDRLQRSTQPFGRIRLKSQFGCMGLSIDGVTFALIANSQLWLKSTEATRDLFCQMELYDRFTYPKRILPMRINYYRVTEAVWLCPQQCESLFYQTYFHVRAFALSQQRLPSRIKDLPNVDRALERRLWHAGIRQVDDLYLLGAKASFLKVKARPKNELKLLFALAGAIEGCHSAVLPKALREDLIHWHDRLN
ncbi:TfoX/Sxy family DNA transformation protein [Morganella psychrotolerans]|uniref:TfoX/Sxy family DNA transformation protein n=1 Tax=Morganella psychrotolerans TaxID=368603 RepID=UPI0009EE02FB|nr:TfoX/Sxy family DNA transformation protein [Morganella psychrotolerans]